MKDNDFYSLQFYCEDYGVSWVFNNGECKPLNNKKWIINLTYEELNKIIENFNNLKTMIDYGKTTT